MAEAYDSNPDLQSSLAKSGVEAEASVTDEGPLYKMFKDAKIPVSKKMGKLWDSRIKQGIAARSDVEKCWSEAIKYYENDQLSHRNSRDKGAGNGKYARRLGNQWSETENVVFSNVTTMLPILYAKNPTIRLLRLSTLLAESRVR
jgi:hypothetical protein